MKQHPGPPGRGLGMELAIPPHKKNSIATETETREFTTTGESSNTDPVPISAPKHC